MENKFIRVDEVAKELDVSKPYAYKIIRQLNEELKAKGFITIAGRVNRQYFNERLYGAERNKVNASIPIRQQKPETWVMKNAKRCCSGRKRNIRSSRKK